MYRGVGLSRRVYNQIGQGVEYCYLLVEGMIARRKIAADIGNLVGIFVPIRKVCNIGELAEE
jgi:hypothetical protein